MTQSTPENSHGSLTWSRAIVAVVLSLAACGIIWFITPYNNFILRNGYISDDYLASSVLMMLLFFVLVFNPLVRFLYPRAALNFRQLALIVGLMFIGANLTSSGLLRELPYSLAQQTRDISEWKDVSDLFEIADLPPSLFPGELIYEANVDAAKYFLLKLPKGESIPWGAWRGPALTWGTFFFAWWMMLIGLAGIVLPQWRDNERMPFPLIRILESIIETPDKGRQLPPLLRKRSFWIASLAVFTIYFFLGLKLYFPNRVPAIPVSWNLTPLFIEEPLSYLPWYIQTGRIYFIFLGVAFFMSSRVAFSIWFFMIVYAAYTLLGNIFAPPFHWGTPHEHRTGAMIVMTLSVLWLGRRHWGRVFRLFFLGDGGGKEDSSSPDDGQRYSFLSPVILLFVILLAAVALCFVGGAEVFRNGWLPWVVLSLGAGLLMGNMFRRLRSDESRRNRQFVFMFLFGALCMFCWMLWLGMQPPWALLLLAVGFMYSLLLARIVAETGIPIIGFYDLHITQIFTLIPIRFVNPISAWFPGVLSSYWGDGSRVSLTTVAMQSMGLDREATPRRQARLGQMFLVVLVLSFLFCGAAHLYLSYNHSKTLDRDPEQPVSAWGAGRLWPARLMLQAKKDEKWDMPVYSRHGHIAFGAGLAGALQWASLRMPKWPLHPVGLLLVYTWYCEQLWISVFIGWLLRSAFVFFGGARLYMAARPIFLGLIMGEVFAVVFWFFIPIILRMLGKTYYVLQILPY